MAPCRGRRYKGKSFASGRGRRYKGISSAAWFRVLLQHAGAVHPCTARTKSPCSDVLRDVGVLCFGGRCLQPPGAGIDEATDIQLAKDAAVRGSGASRPWMACARLLEPWMAESGDAPDPRTAAAPPEGENSSALRPHCRGSPRSQCCCPHHRGSPRRRKLQCFETALPRLPPKPVGSGAFQPGPRGHHSIWRRTRRKGRVAPALRGLLRLACDQNL